MSNVAVLVERDAILATLRAAVEGAVSSRTPRGALVLLGGEAGVGKTSLVTALLGALGPDVVVRRGWCDDIAVAGALAAVVEAAPEVADELDGDRLQLFGRLRARLVERPTVLVLEDVHWADEATLDLLRWLGRRLGDEPLAVVATYRDDEAHRSPPLTRLVAETASATAGRCLTVAPLTVAGVAELVTGAAASLDAHQLHALTGGNPFYVTEVLAAADVGLPPTVREAVLARVDTLTPAAHRVLDVAAVLGARADAGSLLTLAGEPAAALDECVARGMLVADGDGWSFRHELARRAVDDRLPPGRRAALHAAALAALRELGADDRRLTHHAVGAGDHAAVLQHAPRAATSAASLGAHREAVELLRLALRARPTDGPVRRGLYEALSYECYLTDQLDEAITARRQALELAVLDGDARAVGVAQRWLSRLLWFTGRNADSRRFAELAVETLEPLGADAELAMAYSNVAQLAMLRDDTIAAVRWGRRALAMARELGAVNVEMHAANNVGTALAYSTGPHEGRDLLHRSLELAVRHDQHEHAARAYTNLGSVAYMTRHHAEAERVLTAGITYCTERDLDSWRLYMTASLATSLVEQGRLDEAATAAATVLTAPHLSTISFIGAAPAAALADLRRGRDPGDLLERAARSAAGTGESQRLAPIASALAEAAWLAGTEIVADTFEAAWATTLARPDPWRLGELAWWRHVAGLPAAPQLPPIAAPFAALLTAPPREAAERWLASNCPFWAAHALNRSDDLDDARRAVELVEACGATAVADALRRDRRARGQAVPRGPRATTRDHPAALTAREVDVLRPLVDGRSNAEIGAALFLSEKTVAHHVSAVLRKLDEPTRARAAAAAVARELI